MNSKTTGNTEGGFTLLELMVVVAIIGIIASIAIPGYQNFIEKGKRAEAMGNLRGLEGEIEKFYAQNNYFPDIGELFDPTPEDEWGNVYIYLPLQGYPAYLAQARVDGAMVPLNTDYDLYSRGKDGMTRKVITHKDSADDIIRAKDGSFMGVGKDY